MHRSLGRGASHCYGSPARPFWSTTGAKPAATRSAHRRARVAAGDQALADEHGVGAPARRRSAGRADRAPRTRRPAMHVAGHAGGDPRRRSSRSTSRVCRLRALTPMTLAPASSARSASSSVCTSTRAVMPSDSTRSSSDVERVLLQRGDDQQHEVGAVRPRLVQLVRADDEVLAQHRDVHGRAHGGEVGQRAAEPALLGEHADHARAAGGVGRGERGGVGDRRRASPLDGLRRLTSAITPMPGRAQRGHHVARRRGRRAARRLISAKSTAASRAARSARTPSRMESRTLPAVCSIPRGHPLPARPSACRPTSPMLDRAAATAAARIGPARAGVVRRLGGRVDTRRRAPRHGGPVRVGLAVGARGRVPTVAGRRAGGRRRSARRARRPAAVSSTAPSARPAARSGMRRDDPASSGAAAPGAPGRLGERAAGDRRSSPAAGRPRTPTQPPAAATSADRAAPTRQPGRPRPPRRRRPGRAARRRDSAGQRDGTASRPTATVPRRPRATAAVHQASRGGAASAAAPAASSEARHQRSEPAADGRRERPGRGLSTRGRPARARADASPAPCAARVAATSRARADRGAHRGVRPVAARRCAASPPSPPRDSTARALFRHSVSSATGSESATIPPPACT